MLDGVEWNEIPELVDPYGVKGVKLDTLRRMLEFDNTRAGVISPAVVVATAEHALAALSTRQAWIY